MSFFGKIYYTAFPKGGGGYLRRYINVKQQLISKWLGAGKHPKPGPLTLIDFTNRDDAVDAIQNSGSNDGWRTSNDSDTIGGYSNANVRFIANSDEYRRILEGEPLLSNDKFKRVIKKDYSTHKFIRRSGEKIDEDDDDGDFVPFMRWWGTLDTRIGETSRAIRSGYCALISPQVPFDGHDLGHWFNHLEVTVRADGRPYTINLKISTYFPDDLYIYIMRPKGIHLEATSNVETGGEFTRLFIPFTSFVLTANGRVRETQRKLDGGIRIESLGITLMDEQDGDFCFDLARVRVVNYDRRSNQVYGEDDDDAPY
jgi:Complex I intermediate-associated protein 30 (CIA30)